MTRVVYGTTNTSTNGTAVQPNTDTAGRVMVFSVHSRAANTGYVYFGSDSNVSSASGWELGANEDFTWRYKDYDTAPSIAPADHWINATSTSQSVDWMMLLEN